MPTLCSNYVDPSRSIINQSGNRVIGSGALAPEGESSEEFRADMVRERAIRVPMGRIAQGDDIARMAAFLASAESAYITGLSISVSVGSKMN